MQALRNSVGRVGAAAASTGSGPAARRTRERRGAFTALPWIVALIGWTATAATPGDSLVLTQVPARGPIPAARAGGLLRADFPEGSRIVVVTARGATRVLTPDFAAAADPEVSFDATRILFAGRRTMADPWCIHEMRADGGGARLVSCGPGSARAPIYLGDMHTLNPVSTDTWTQIAFVGGRSREVNEAGVGEARSLYACLLDGTRTRRLTYNLSSDIDPALLPDGRVVYASWQRHDLSRGPSGRFALLAVNMDGTDAVPYVTADGPAARQMPAVTGDGLVVYVEAEAPAGDGAGRLASVTQRRPLHSYRSITRPGDGLFAWPAADPPGGVLVSMRAAGGGGDHGVVRLDPATGRRTPVFDAPGWHDVQAKRLAPRPVRDGRSSPVRDDDPDGTIYVLDVGINDLTEGALAGGARILRILEGLPRGIATAGDGPLAARRLLGEAPIAADGSAQVVVPANTPLLLQVIDADGMAGRGGSWTWTRNHHEQGCVGCHEDPERAPPNRFVEAVRSEAARAAPPPAARRTVDFRHEVVPILRARCVACHGAAGTPPALDPGSGDDAAARAVYDRLIGSHVDPGRARTSPLVWHLTGRNTSRPWDGAAAARAARGIPAGGPGVDADARRLMIEWIDFGAAWDARADAEAADASRAATATAAGTPPALPAPPSGPLPPPAGAGNGR